MSPRQSQILAVGLVVNNLRDTAELLSMPSLETVRTHIERIKDKAGAGSYQKLLAEIRKEILCPDLIRLIRLVGNGPTGPGR